MSAHPTSTFHISFFLFHQTLFSKQFARPKRLVVHSTSVFVQPAVNPPKPVSKGLGPQIHAGSGMGSEIILVKVYIFIFCIHSFISHTNSLSISQLIKMQVLRRFDSVASTQMLTKVKKAYAKIYKINFINSSIELLFRV